MMGYRGKRWKVRGTKRGRETVKERVNKRESDSVEGASERAERMKSG